MHRLVAFGTLTLLLAAAATVLFGGSRLAKKEKKILIQRDRLALERVAQKLQQKLTELDTYYQRNLEDLWQEIPLFLEGDTWELTRRCREIAGVERFSLLPLPEQGERSTHFDVSVGGVVPTPSLHKNRERPEYPLGEKIFIPFDQQEGPYKARWLLPKGSRFGCYWIPKTITVRGKKMEAVAVLTFDRKKVTQIINRELTQILTAEYATAPITNNPEVLVDPWKKVIRVLGKENPPQTSPDKVTPLHSHLGIWQIRTWDRMETEMYDDPRVVSIASVLSLFLACCGVILFLVQQRAFQTARQRISFVNSVSHELRAPLTNMLLNTDLAMEALPEKNNAIKRLHIVKEEINRLGRLVSNVLAFTRNRRRKLEIHARPCIPQEIVQHVLQQFQPSLQRLGIDVELQGDAREKRILDDDALSQILSNLVSNVEKYAATGKHLKVTLQLSEQDLVLEISDNGPGIPYGAEKKIFQPFQRLSRKTKDAVGGTGLGLSISAELAKLMGGSLQWIPSQKGARFRLQIPAPPIQNKKP